MTTVTRQQMAQMLADKIGKSECWSTFNEEYRYRTFLNDLSMCNRMVQPAEVPPAPEPNDYDNLAC